MCTCDKDIQIKMRDEEIKRLKDIIRGTITVDGEYNPYEHRWDINHGEIITRLIQDTGRYCQSHACSLFFTLHEIEQKLEQGKPNWKQSYIFAIHDRGVDDKEEYEERKQNVHFYRKVWQLDINTSSEMITMELHEKHYISLKHKYY